MMRSMYSGISGLRAHQVKMDVIGNNIANVNTIGFKASRVTFQEIYNQTLKSASAAAQTGGIGGTNPQQVGLGISVASVDVLHARGSVQRTDKATDLAIDGDGFFVVSDGINQYYTRAGNFDVDPLGNLVTAGGLHVLGWSRKTINASTGTESVDTAGIPQKINLANLSMSAKATDAIRFEGNLDNNTEIGGNIEYSTSVFDSQGNEHKVNILFTKTGANEWKWTIKPNDMYTTDYPMNENRAKGEIVPLMAKKSVRYAHEIESIKVENQDYTIEFAKDQADFDTKKDSLTGNTVLVLMDGTQRIKTAFSTAINSGDNIQINYNHSLIDKIPLSGTNSYHGEVRFTGDGSIHSNSDFLYGANLEFVMKNENGADNIILDSDNIVFHEDKFTQSNNETTVKAEVSGYSYGTLNSISIDPQGRIIGIYSNGQAREDAVLAVSRFVNPGGLQKLGDNLFQLSSNSGNPIIGRAGIDGRGVINPGALEMSNVDLAKEFTEMIVAQRGFQANSRIITTSDELLQELVNLKR